MANSNETSAWTPWVVLIVVTLICTMLLVLWNAYDINVLNKIAEAHHGSI